MTFRPSQPRKRLRWLALGTVVAVLSMLGASAALAVHDDELFELDTSTSTTVCTPIVPPCGNANVADDPAVPGDDWATLYADGGSAFAKTFITDPVSSAENSFYTGGGSKDVRDIPDWAYATTNDVVPDKDDLEHGFAAAYTDSGNPAPKPDHTLVYFGVDRYDNNGDAETGFWFFKDPVTLDGNGGFDGQHQEGDVLVLADWGGSNPVGAFTVYEWVGGKNPLALVSDTAAGQADCAKRANDDMACAVVNRQIVDPPWPFLDKGGSADIRPLELFEAGIDLTALFGEDQCFSSFLASTRSSHSVTAQLKDFVLGQFEQCGAELRTQVSDTEIILGESVTDDAIITVSGSSPPAPTGDVTFTVNGVDVSVEDLANATQSGDEYTVTSDAFTPTEPGEYCFSASWPGDENYTDGPYEDNGENECFTVIELQPEIDTEQSFFPNDEATITVAAGGGDLDGSVDFQLFDNSACTGTPLYQKLDVDVSGGLSVTVATDNTTVAVDESIDLWWKVTYTSDIAVHNDAISDCVENSSLTIDNG